MNRQVNKVLKVALVGESQVGKTQLIQRFIHNNFSNNHRQTIGVEFSSKEVLSKGVNYSLQIWDTAGQHRYKAVAAAYLRGAAICVIVYDITNRQSFENIGYYQKEISQNCSQGLLVVIVGNKCDQEQKRLVEREEGQALARRMKAFFLQSSAKDAINIEKVFTSDYSMTINKLSSIQFEAIKNSKRSRMISFAKSQGQLSTPSLQQLYFQANKHRNHKLSIEFVQCQASMSLKLKTDRKLIADTIIKVRMTGTMAVGNTQLILRLFNNSFFDEQSYLNEAILLLKGWIAMSSISSLRKRITDFKYGIDVPSANLKQSMLPHPHSLGTFQAATKRIQEIRKYCQLVTNPITVNLCQQVKVFFIIEICIQMKEDETMQIGNLISFVKYFQYLNSSHSDIFAQAKKSVRLNMVLIMVVGKISRDSIGIDRTWPAQ